MDYLIDTQVLSGRLLSRQNYRTWRILPYKVAVSMSASSVCSNITIKQKIGKLPELPVKTENLVEQIRRDGFRLLPVTDRHIARYDDIPLLADHRYPFDRLLLATTLAEQMPLISADEYFTRYSELINVVW